MASDKNGKKKNLKLTKKDIGTPKNNLLHSINNIRANENKVVVFLVAVFICVFGFLGYFTLKIDSTGIASNIGNMVGSGVFVSSSVVTLDKDDVMTDEEGLKSDPITLSISNEFPDVYSFKIKLVDDDFNKKVCGCENEISKESIRYSLDGETVDSLSDEKLLLGIDSVDSFSGKDINVRLWISNENELDDESHFHGRFVLEPCSLEENN
jgi:hypothetical protein